MAAEVRSLVVYEISGVLLEVRVFVLLFGREGLLGRNVLLPSDCHPTVFSVDLLVHAGPSILALATEICAFDTRLESNADHER